MLGRLAHSPAGIRSLYCAQNPLTIPMPEPMDPMLDLAYPYPADRGLRLADLVRESGRFYGDSYFSFVAQAMAATLGAEWALVGLVEEPGRVRVLGEVRLEDVPAVAEFDLVETPFSSLLDRGTELVLLGLDRLHPAFTSLTGPGFQAFAGRTLGEGTGSPQGFLAVAFRKPLKDGAGVLRVLDLFRARTLLEIERTQMESNLRESSLRTRSLLEALAEGMLVFDARGVVIDCNRAAEQILQAGREQLVGLEPLPPGLRFWRENGEPWPLSEQPPQTSLRTGEPLRDQVMRIERPDGSEVWVSFNAEPIRLPHKSGVSGCVATFRDITERRRSESDRRRLEAELQHIQRMDSLGSLAGGLAHDMNNVLGAIMALATSLQAQCGGSEVLAQGLDTIAQATERGRDLVRGLLEFARKEVEAPVLLDLNELVRREADLLERTTLQRVALELHLGADLPPVQGDRRALASALMNLCINALDAMPRGGTLRLTTDRGADGMVELRVQDSGCGMSPEVQARAFEPFFTTKAPGKGTGLGLSIVYGTVKAHGGSLDVISQPGVGTTVALRLPAQLPMPEPPVAPEEATAPGVPLLRILLVDDDPLIRASVPTLLETLGHSVDAAASGEEALARVWNGAEPDLVVLDLNMPGLGGAETLRHLRVLRPHLPVLLATGFLDAETKAFLASFEAVQVLPKPFGIKEIRRALAGMEASVHREPSA